MASGEKNLQRLKCDTLELAREHQVPVVNDGSLVADLVPVGNWILQEHELVRSMARWRQESAQMFLAHFDSTADKTEKYLRDMSIADPARILFIIYREGAAVGHIGFSGLTQTDAELDNVMRGESTGVPGFMRAVSIALLRWGFDELGVDSVHLQATSHNGPAIGLYSSLGFQLEHSLPLKSYSEGEFIFHRPCPEAESDVDFRLQVMRLHRQDFLDKSDTA